MEERGKGREIGEGGKRTYRWVELCLTTSHRLSGCLLGNSSGVPDNTPVSLSPILARSR